MGKDKRYTDMRDEFVRQGLGKLALNRKNTKGPRALTPRVRTGLGNQDNRDNRDNTGGRDE